LVLPIYYFFFFYPYHRELMEQAKSLLDEGRQHLAVVVAQTACEVLTEQLMTALTERLDEPLRKWARGRLPRTHDLDDDRVRGLYVALTADAIQTAPFWASFKQHVDRRHQVVHRGTKVSAAEGQESYDAVQQLLTHLEQIQAKVLGK
jgi:hypothetical protein